MNRTLTLSLLVLCTVCPAQDMSWQERMDKMLQMMRLDFSFEDQSLEDSLQLFNGLAVNLVIHPEANVFTTHSVEGNLSLAELLQEILQAGGLQAEKRWHSLVILPADGTLPVADAFADPTEDWQLPLEVPVTRRGDERDLAGIFHQPLAELGRGLAIGARCGERFPYPIRVFGRMPLGSYLQAMACAWGLRTDIHGSCLVVYPDLPELPSDAERLAGLQPEGELSARLLGANQGAELVGLLAKRAGLQVHVPADLDLEARYLLVSSSFSLRDALLIVLKATGTRLVASDEGYELVALEGTDEEP